MALVILSQLLELWTQKYCQTFVLHPVKNGKHLTGNGFILQHDNNLKHTANAVKANLEGKTHNETVSVMDWLWGGQSMTDSLNTADALWDHLNRKWNKTQPTSKDACNVRQEDWLTTPIKTQLTRRALDF